MNYIKGIAALAVLAVSAHVSSVAAQTVARCDSCSKPLEYKAFATTQPLGEVVIVNYSNGQMIRYNNWLDGKTKVTEPMGLPAGMKDWYFGFVSDITTLANSNAQVIIETGPGYVNNNSLMRVNPWLNFDNWNAYSVVESPANRSNLGGRLAESLTPSIPGVSESLARTLVSAGIGYGQATVVFRIHWRDGSTSMFTFTADAPDAIYSDGNSKDKDGNPIPDAAATGSNSTSIYVGTYRFGSQFDANAWRNAAGLYGIPVQGPATATVIVCSVQDPQGPARPICTAH